jgi:hypothetical protein
MNHTRSHSAEITTTPAICPDSTLIAAGQARPLDVAERSFRLLMQGPQPLAVDGRTLGEGLPARPIPLDELGTLLLHPACSRATRDEVWRHLIEQARTHQGAWMVAAVALAAPMLRSLVRTFTETLSVEREELEAEVLACFMEALGRVELSWSHPLLRLSRLTQFAVIRAHAADRPDLLPEPDTNGDLRALRYPTGHADLLLARAVELGIITADAAELISMTRLDHISLTAYSRARGLLYCTALKRRKRAEARLRQALLSGDLSGNAG